VHSKTGYILLAKESRQQETNVKLAAVKNNDAAVLPAKLGMAKFHDKPRFAIRTMHSSSPSPLNQICSATSHER